MTEYTNYMTPGHDGSCLLTDGHPQAAEIQNAHILSHLDGVNMCHLTFAAWGCGNCSAKATLTVWSNPLSQMCNILLAFHGGFGVTARNGSYK